MRIFLFLLFALYGLIAHAQNNTLTYVGNSGKETLFDVIQLSDETILAVGYSDNLDWVPTDLTVQFLSYSGTIPNSLGVERFGIILHLSSDLSDLMDVVAMPQGAVEDIRFIKTNSAPYAATGDLYVSCTTADTYDNDGGYVIAKLNQNFINGIPTSLEWHRPVWAESYAQAMHPWDVTSDGRVYYVSGAAHGYDWSAMYCLDQTGQRMVVENWRTHWLTEGGEWKGVPASSYPNGVENLAYSGIALKIWGRCELRSWTQNDFDIMSPDGNGGLKKGRWPADFLFSGPCDPNDPSADGPGYNGYSHESCCPVWGASSLVVDRNTNHVYLGMNFKSYSQPADSPDFEPAVIAFDDDGSLVWWSRLYHEITPMGDTVYSLPDQYIDALAIDYTHGQLVVAARAHGNNTENLWEGNTIAANSGASGFQNQFTGTNGNIHESWLGKLELATGQLQHSTYVAEYAEGTGSLGAPHADPNLMGWPDPNSGWPDVNTTYIAKNNLKVSSNGDVLMAGQGRRTITTANAWQTMVLPQNGGQSCWNSFLRLYNHSLSYPKYSSLVIGQWDTLTQQGGDNTRLYGVYKTNQGILAVGKQLSNEQGVPSGEDILVNNVPSWGKSFPENESAILVYLQTDSLVTTSDVYNGVSQGSAQRNTMHVFPNPAKDQLCVTTSQFAGGSGTIKYKIYDGTGRLMQQGFLNQRCIALHPLDDGYYIIECEIGGVCSTVAFVVQE